MASTGTASPAAWSGIASTSPGAEGQGHRVGGAAIFPNEPFQPVSAASLGCPDSTLDSGSNADGGHRRQQDVVRPMNLSHRLRIRTRQELTPDLSLFGVRHPPGSMSQAGGVGFFSVSEKEKTEHG